MFMTLCEHIAGKEFIMADEKTVDDGLSICHDEFLSCDVFA